MLIIIISYSVPSGQLLIIFSYLFDKVDLIRPLRTVPGHAVMPTVSCPSRGLSASARPASWCRPGHPRCPRKATLLAHWTRLGVEEMVADSDRCWREAWAREAPPDITTAMFVRDHDGQLHIPRTTATHKARRPSQLQVRSSVSLPPQNSSTTFSTPSKVKLRHCARRTSTRLLAKLMLDHP